MSQKPAGVPFATYDETGRILFTGVVPASMLELQGANIVQGEADVLLDYVVGGAITPRPANPAVLDGMTLSNLPLPCVITIEGTRHTCNETHANLSFSQPATYPVTVSAWPMLDATFQVTQA